MRLVALVFAALVLAAPAVASERHPTLGDLENQVMCPVCYPETIGQSSSPAAQRIKQFIQRRIDAGDTKSEIESKLVAQFGPSILASPPKHGFDLLAWLLPIVGILGGAGVIALLAWRWTRRREEPAVLPPHALNGRPLEPDLERRLDEELARFDG